MKTSIATKQIINITIAFIILLLPFLAHAQAPDPGGDVDAVPIDGGISLLVAAGVGYGIKKIKESKVVNKTKF